MRNLRVTQKDHECPYKEREKRRDCLNLPGQICDCGSSLLCATATLCARDAPINWRPVIISWYSVIGRCSFKKQKKGGGGYLKVRSDTAWLDSLICYSAPPLSFSLYLLVLALKGKHFAMLSDSESAAL